MNRVVIVDTGLCNLDSIARAVEECGGDPLVTNVASDLSKGVRIVLPGVGAFPKAMQHLNERGLVDALREQVLGNGIPFLGICLGMQLLATSGAEGSRTPGLGWIRGEARLLDPVGDERVPHIGWNDVVRRAQATLFEGIDAERDFYFVHSYALAPDDSTDIAAMTDYAGGFVSAVERDHIFGVQFHPEKSQKAGFQVIRNFLAV